jgi:hypothetical protein
MNLAEARKHLDLARKQFDKAATDWWEPADPPSCVTNVFYAYENVVVALAECFSIKWKKNHYHKAEVAAQLAKDGKVTTDISDEMLRLNDLRKDVSYGEPGDDLCNEDLENLVTELENFIDEAEEILTRLEDEAAEDDDDDDE